MPRPLVAVMLAFLVVVFAPLGMVTPDLPHSLPPLAYDARAVYDWHARVRPVARTPAYLDESFLAVATASAQRDTRALADAQRAFASLVVDAAGHDEGARHRLREAYLQRFLRAAESGARDPLVAVARRHAIAGAGAFGISRAMLIAWFDLRWESLSAREAIRGQTLPLDELLARIPAAERRALTAWAVSAECPALLGLPEEDARTTAQIARCASVRRDFVTVAHSLDRAYPLNEANATVEALRGRALQDVARSSADNSGALQSAARDAFVQAYGLFQDAAREQPSRRLARYMLGASRGSSAD